MSEAEPASAPAVAAGPASPGQALAAARAELKLSVADVSQQIKYGVKQIAAIEADDYAKLPGATFVRGMIRSYAKLVQLDPQPLLADLGRREIPAAATVDLRSDKQEPFVEGGRKSNHVYALLSLAALVTVAVVAFEWYASPPAPGEVVVIPPKAVPSAAAESQPVPATAAGLPGKADTPLAQERSPSVAPVAATAAAPARGRLKRIELEFDKLSWVQIKQADGKVMLSQLNPAGSRQVVEGVPPFAVVIGNAANVRLNYNDAPVDLRPHFKIDVARLTLE
jgi:cytoskeleton protein RodZ